MWIKNFLKKFSLLCEFLTTNKMKYDRKNLEAKNASQTLIQNDSSERVYLSAGAIASAIALLFDVYQSENFSVTTGVAVGVLIAAFNYRLWKFIVANLIADAVRRSTSGEKSPSLMLLFLLSTKLFVLVAVFAILCKLNSALVVPTLGGIVAYVLGGTLLILLISYNKR